MIRRLSTIRQVALALCLLFATPAWSQEVAAEAPQTIEQQVDAVFGEAVGAVAMILFWEIPGLGMPLIVAWLLFGAVFFTFRMRFVNLRLFRHAIDLVRGKYTVYTQLQQCE